MSSLTGLLLIAICLSTNILSLRDSPVAYWGLGIVLIGFSVETRGLNEAMVFGLGLLAGYFGLVSPKK